MQDRIILSLLIKLFLHAVVRMETNGVSRSDTLRTLFMTNDAARSDIAFMLAMFMFDSAFYPLFMSSSLVSLVRPGVI